MRKLDPSRPALCKAEQIRRVRHNVPSIAPSTRQALSGPRLSFPPRHRHNQADDFPFRRLSPTPLRLPETGPLPDKPAPKDHAENLDLSPLSSRILQSLDRIAAKRRA